jgi:arylsulfatase A
MPVRQFVIVFSLLVFSCYIGTVDAIAETASRPNIVLIISDDQGYRDFGFMGHPVVKTPHLDRLAQQSARFINGYVPSSVCRPSLATLLTGLYPHQHKIHFNHPPPGFSQLMKLPYEEYLRQRGRADVLIRSVPTLPRALSRHGYKTFQTGKYWEGHYRNAGFTDGMTLGKKAAIEQEFGLQDAHGNGDAGLSIGRKTLKPIYDFLDNVGEAPFFVWYAPFLPHTPHTAPDQFVRMYSNRDDVPQHLVRYYASCSWFDETVGELLNYLKETGRDRNTLVVFVSDNGWEPSTANPSRETSTSKRSPFETGVRTPILIHWPGQTQPATYDTPINSVDLVPTLLAAAGLKSEIPDLPGINLLPTAVEKKALPKRPIFGEIYPGNASVLGNPSADISYRWVRSGDWKLIVPHVSQDGKYYKNYLKSTALYQLSTDEREQRNLANEPAHLKRVEQLRQLLDRWWKPASAHP